MIRSRWWSVCGSDPVYWLLMPVWIATIAVLGPFWIAAWAIRQMEDWPDRLDWVGETPVLWLRDLYQPRRAARVAAWKAKRAAQATEGAE